MSAAALDDSQRSAARVAALAFVISTVLVIYGNYGLREPLIAGGDMAEAVQRMTARPTQFRLSSLIDVMYCIGDVTFAVALYIVLRPVHRHLALLATAWRLMYSVTAMLVALSYLRVIGLVTEAPYVDAVGAEPLQALIRSLRFATGDQYYVGLAFSALSATAYAWLLLRARYVPPALAVFGLASSAWCVFCTLVYVAHPQFEQIVNLWWFDLPMAIYMLMLSLWFLVPGRLSDGNHDFAP